VIEPNLYIALLSLEVGILEGVFDGDFEDLLDVLGRTPGYCSSTN
jgi:hypothetical protein